MATASQEHLASRLLGEPVGAYIARQRRPDDDVKRSWRKIALNLKAATDGMIDVTGGTVHRWSKNYAKRGGYEPPEMNGMNGI